MSIRAINDAQLTTLGTCGDVNRNTMCCPLCELDWRAGLGLDRLCAALAEHFTPRSTAYWEIWCDGERFYVSEFRHRVEGPSVVRVCDMALNLIETLEIGQPIHNVYVEDGALYSLVSRKPGGVNVYDLGSGRQWRIPLNLPDDQLLRGLAKTKDRWYVGVSRWETWRDKRHVGDSVVLELDNEFRQVGEFVLPDGGPVCELRVLDAPDLAHHGIVL